MSNVKIAFIVTVGLISSIFFFDSWSTVSAGNRGVRLRFNAISGDVVDSGFYWKMPLIEEIKTINVQTQKVEIDADSASSDLQTVRAKVALNYNVDPGKVLDIYQNIGTEYASKLIDPALQESVKAITSGYTADQLITKRTEVNGHIYDLVKSKLSPYGILVTGLNIVNFNFSNSFDKAIEDKVTAEQNALASKNKLEQIKFEAQQSIESARGKAEALQIESNALKANPEVLELRWIEKWNGILPSTMTGESTLLVTPK